MLMFSISHGVSQHFTLVGSSMKSHESAILILVEWFQCDSTQALQQLDLKMKLKLSLALLSFALLCSAWGCFLSY